MARPRARADGARVPGGARPLSDRYGFAADPEGERTRLAAVERALDPATVAALREAGVRPGWRCWEVGAGRGSIATWLADVVGRDGEVVATDLDGRWYEGTVPLVRHDVTADVPPDGPFDLVHARLVLEHLADPASAVRALASALRPGGVLVAEDAVGLRFAATPESGALARVAGPWERAAHAVGWDARYGERLPGDLIAAGIAGLRGREHRLVAAGGDAWSHVRAGLQRLRAEIAEAGASGADVDAALRCLADPDVLVTGAPVLTIAGRRGS